MLNVFNIIYLNNIVNYTENKKKSIRKSHLIDIRVIMKAFIVCQSQKMLISVKKCEILRLYYLSSRYSNKKRANQDRM